MRIVNILNFIIRIAVSKKAEKVRRCGCAVSRPNCNFKLQKQLAIVSKASVQMEMVGRVRVVALQLQQLQRHRRRGISKQSHLFRISSHRWWLYSCNFTTEMSSFNAVEIKRTKIEEKKKKKKKRKVNFVLTLARTALKVHPALPLYCFTVIQFAILRNSFRAHMPTKKKNSPSKRKESEKLAACRQAIENSMEPFLDPAVPDGFFYARLIDDFVLPKIGKALGLFFRRCYKVMTGKKWTGRFSALWFSL
jgi:hypothetical protein